MVVTIGRPMRILSLVRSAIGILVDQEVDIQSHLSHRLEPKVLRRLSTPAAPKMNADKA